MLIAEISKGKLEKRESLETTEESTRTERILGPRGAEARK